MTSRVGGIGNRLSVSQVSAVIFDMDGVLFEGRNFWLDLHKRYGTAKAGVAAADQYMLEDYELLASKVVGQLWLGKPAAVYEDLVRARKYQPGVSEVFRFLRRKRIMTAIVSSGPEPLALRAKHDLGIDIVRANALEVVDGVLTGRSTINVPEAEKAAVGLQVISLLGIDPGKVASVGDSASDVPLAQLVALPIAYDASSDQLVRAAAHTLRHGELNQLPALLLGT